MHLVLARCKLVCSFEHDAKKEVKAPVLRRKMTEYERSGFGKRSTTVP
jgi:hypothetical protein